MCLLVRVLPTGTATEIGTIFVARAPITNHPMSSLFEWRITDAGWVQVFADPERAGRSALNLAVDDIDAAISELTGRGLEPGEIQAADKGVRISALTDPDGNTVTLIGGFREAY